MKQAFAIKNILLFVLYKLMPIKSIRKQLKQYHKYIKIIHKQQKVADFLHKNYINQDLDNFVPKAKKDLVSKKIIWQYWGQGIDENTPEIIKICTNSVKKYRGDYQVILLSNNTIADYIDLPDFVYDKLENNPQFSYVFFSDFLRISLLSVYGGVWCDATIYLTDKIPQKLLNKDFFMFQRATRPSDYKYWHKHNMYYFGWDKNFKVRSLSSFIIAQPNNPLITELIKILYNYWNNEDTIKHYFLFQILFNEVINKYQNCEIICDTIATEMSRYINEPYTQELWNKITQSNPIHKLTYYDKCEENSILQYVLNK